AWPIDAFFHKVVMLRNRLRVLEQNINGLDVPPDVKLKLQSYITGCYGSLTSFNVLFADPDARFRGTGGDDQGVGSTGGTPLRLLFVSSGLTRGGAEGFLVRLVVRLVRRGHVCGVASLG